VRKCEEKHESKNEAENENKTEAEHQRTHYDMRLYHTQHVSSQFSSAGSKSDPYLLCDAGVYIYSWPLRCEVSFSLQVVNQARICLTTVVTQFDPLRCLRVRLYSTTTVLASVRVMDIYILN
jgi:hypothetical protein